MIFESTTTTTEEDYYNYNNIGETEEFEMVVAAEVFTRPEQIALSWVTRISAVISFASGLYIFYAAWKRRHHAYHRLMLGLSIHILLWSPWNMYGTAAVPFGTPDVYGAVGTTGTCSVQGFFIQLSMCIPFYYVFLSCHSFVVIVYANFNPEKYVRIEKCIHILVHIYPIGSAIYLLLMDAFNSTGGMT